MLVAHMPAGYITAKALKKESKPAHIIASLLFSIWPDLDLLYFYIFDKTKTFHHTYFTHLPVALLAALIVTLPLFRLKFFEKIKVYYILFFTNWLIHLILDTFTGGIMWFYPFDKTLVLFIKIPAVYKSWILSFITHWSFGIEILIIAVSVILLVKTKKGRCQTQTSYI